MDNNFNTFTEFVTESSLTEYKENFKNEKEFKQVSKFVASIPNEYNVSVSNTGGDIMILMPHDLGQFILEQDGKKVKGGTDSYTYSQNYITKEEKVWYMKYPGRGNSYDYRDGYERTSIAGFIKFFNNWIKPTNNLFEDLESDLKKLGVKEFKSLVSWTNRKGNVSATFGFNYKNSIVNITKSFKKKSTSGEIYRIWYSSPGNNGMAIDNVKEKEISSKIEELINKL